MTFYSESNFQVEFYFTNNVVYETSWSSDKSGAQAINSTMANFFLKLFRWSNNNL